ncbi:hypothetical protein POM88_036135 [Heracleum sosnowskyi]|uniref:Uncharacterized protein n=1 Tax=Heracleum sosnowskyi TaxID=360622 RepID=A0AAD8HNN5_9APIA|nr:hypothetical protein POM88_036135 [Heracleum sosnowskyi]
MAFYGEHGRVAKPHSNLPDQKTMDVISYKIKVHKLMLLKRKKEEEFEKNWDLKKELAKRNERRKRIEAMDPAVWEKHKMSPEEICQGVKLLLASSAAQREGIVTGDRSMFRQDIDIDSGSLDTFRICVRGSSTPNYADDA